MTPFTYIAGPRHPEEWDGHEDGCASHGPVQGHLWLSRLSSAIDLAADFLVRESTYGIVAMAMNTPGNMVTQRL